MSCEWLTAKQAAEEVQVSTASIWRWVRKGDLPYSRTPGGAIRICKANLMRDSEDHAMKGMKDFITGGEDGPAHRVRG